MMIVYKRKLKSEDVMHLMEYEELIYYMSEIVAVTITPIQDFYLVRKMKISNNALIEELKLDTIDEIMAIVD